MKIQIIELESMKDLLTLTKHFLFRMDFGDLFAYYSGATSDNFIGLNLLLTEDKYENYIKADEKGKVLKKDRQDPGTVAIIHVVSDTLLRNILANYITVTRGVTKKNLDQMTENIERYLGAVKGMRENGT